MKRLLIDILTVAALIGSGFALGYQWGIRNGSIFYHFTVPDSIEKPSPVPTPRPDERFI